MLVLLLATAVAITTTYDVTSPLLTFALFPLPPSPKQVVRALRPIDWVSPGLVKRVRGVAYRY